MADLEMISKGIIRSVNDYMAAQKQISDMQNRYLMMDMERKKEQYKNDAFSKAMSGESQNTRPTQQLPDLSVQPNIQKDQQGSIPMTLSVPKKDNVIDIRINEAKKRQQELIDIGNQFPEKAKNNPQYSQSLKNVSDRISKLEDYKLKNDLTNSKEEKVNQKLSENIIASANSALENVKEIKNNMQFFGLRGVIPAFPGTKKVTWEANLNQLVSQQTLDIINSMKQASRTGATGFGALNEKELNMLQSAASKLKKDLPPEDAKRFLDEIELKFKKILKGQNENVQSPLPPDQSSTPDEIDNFLSDI